MLQEPPSTIFVAGATGGVGQLTTAKLLEVSLTHTECHNSFYVALSRCSYCIWIGQKLPTTHTFVPKHVNCLSLQRGFTVKALARNKERAAQLFSNHPNLQVRIRPL